MLTVRRIQSPQGKYHDDAGQSEMFPVYGLYMAWYRVPPIGRAHGFFAWATAGSPLDAARKALARATERINTAGSAS